jgi:hypothetical protein
MPALEILYVPHETLPLNPNYNRDWEALGWPDEIAPY